MQDLNPPVSPKHRPFMKWPGNKYQCINILLRHLPKAPRLIEPFLGSGAVFMNTQYDDYLLAEENQYLIDLYVFLQKKGQAFIDDCATLFIPENNDKARYYEFREVFNHERDPYQSAKLFLYLNRHGFNGLCRFNSHGKYNVPFGRYSKPYFPYHEMLMFYQKSQGVKFIKQDFRQTFRQAMPGDAIYCDPPYLPRAQESNFSHYTTHKFG